jgi:hypothetical protein
MSHGIYSSATLKESGGLSAVDSNEYFNSMNFVENCTYTSFVPLGTDPLVPYISDSGEDAYKEKYIANFAAGINSDDFPYSVNNQKF